MKNLADLLRDARFLYLPVGIGIIAILALIGLFCAYYNAAVSKVRQRLLPRGSLPSEAWAKKYFSGEKEQTARRVMNVLKKVYDSPERDLDMSMVMPEDLYDDDLHLAFIDSLGTVE